MMVMLLEGKETKVIYGVSDIVNEV